VRLEVLPWASTSVRQGAGLAGVAGGPAAPATIPLGAAGGGAGGAALGGFVGGAAGYVVGQIACRTGSGGSGGSGGSKTDTNKLRHVFDPKHNLGSLVQKFGNEENAWNAIQEAGAEQLTGKGVADGARASIQVGGETITVTGYNSPTGYAVGNAWKP
jgi:hypothetical protein